MVIPNRAEQLMCVEDSRYPDIITLNTRETSQGLVVDYSMGLGKITTYSPSLGTHKSNMGFSYAKGPTIWDPNGVRNSHDQCLHFMGSPDSATDQLGNSYGSHVLCVLPTPYLWGDPNTAWKDRCWHDLGCRVVCCMTCEGVTTDVLSLPEFIKEMKVLPPGRSDLIIPSDIWTQQRVLPWGSELRRTQLRNASGSFGQTSFLAGRRTGVVQPHKHQFVAPRQPS